MIFLWILIGTIGRLVIHIPDVTPLTSLCLLAPTAFSKRYSALIMLIVLILSDVCLHFLDHYAVFGLWTVFNYSGWMAVLLLGFLFSKKPSLVHAVFFTLFSSVFFWIWTNFGTWCTTQLYAHTMRG
ncbi:MAG: hypothetical protein NTU49_04290, partial [Gammaproteobacteria bacterium]|nr:hypothetical protein [Gammaproteobacteria bacterium]